MTSASAPGLMPDSFLGKMRLRFHSLVRIERTTRERWPWACVTISNSQNAKQIKPPPGAFFVVDLEGFVHQSFDVIFRLLGLHLEKRNP
ncbi:MAG: hypothetical protein CTY12_02130 [Methylotenera sp.]|nr:MAG: hypothetical protein CTY12_02130 [Methylotenera sp.]